MTKRAQAVLAGLLPLVGIWVGCNAILGTQAGLPEGSGGASAASASSAGTTAATGATTGAAGAGTTAGTGTGTGGTASASSASSASSSSAASSSGAVDCDSGIPCDCDGDGDNADTPACDHDGGDCNDHDPLVNSKQTKWFTVKGSNGWDYNCDGTDDLEYQKLIVCPSGLMCDSSTVGWEGSTVPICGQSAPQGTCKGSGPVGCTYDVATTVQGCH